MADQDLPDFDQIHPALMTDQELPDVAPIHLVLMADRELPEFEIIGASIQKISHEQTSLATEMGRMKNLPPFDPAGWVLQVIQTFSNRLNDHFDEINCHLQA